MRQYGSKYGGRVDAIQIEAPREVRYNSLCDAPCREKYVTAVAASITDFLNGYYQTLLT